MREENERERKSELEAFWREKIFEVQATETLFNLAQYRVNRESNMIVTTPSAM